MKTILSDKFKRILKAKKILEKNLNVKITNRGKEIKISGKPEEEYDAEKVIEAINFGFSIPTALLIKTHEYVFEVIPIKNYTTRKDLMRIKARIIGKKGKTLKTLNQLTKCYFETKGYEVGIIGDPEYIENAQNAVISLIKGSKQGNVYAYLEKHQIKPIYDLGLKKQKP